MKKITYLTIPLLVLHTLVFSQTVDIEYLNPILGSSTSTYQFLRFGNPQAYTAGLMWNNTSTKYGNGNDFSIFTYGDRDITLMPGTGNVIMFPSEGNNVGIGVADPQSKLHLKNGGQTIQLATGSNTSGYAFQLGVNDDGVNLANNSNYRGFNFSNNMGNLLKITHTGRVGIGTTNPASTLHVEGKIATGQGGVLHLDWTNEANWGGNSNRWAGYIGFNARRSDGDAKDMYHGTNRYTNKGVFEGSNYGFRWLYRNRTNNDSDGQHLLTEHMRLTTNGNLGIGTTNPGTYKLAVKGKIRAEEIKVETGWADYVFNDDYDLPTLDEVEKHIKTKGHLINIPSAKEVAKNGVQLGEMNKLLLEKIEELTLYLIDMKKENQNQQERILKLEKKLQND